MTNHIWILHKVLDDGDIDFINETTVQTSVVDPDVNENDSGWCDASTGARIVLKTTRALFLPQSDEEPLLLKLKYDDLIQVWATNQNK